MKGNGKMINNMAMDVKNGRMELNLKVIIKKVKNMVKANFNGLMVHNMMEILLKIIFRERELIFGQMEENI